MRTVAFVLICALLVSGCALQPVAQSTDTYAVCKTADVATTAYALHHGFHELNPLVKMLIGHGMFPLVFIAFATWYVLKEVDKPEVTEAANAVTCLIAVRNVVLLAK